MDSQDVAGVEPGIDRGSAMKLTPILAAVAFAFAGVAQAADMDCCKDGSCACCTHKTDTQPKPEQPDS